MVNARADTERRIVGQPNFKLGERELQDDQELDPRQDNNESRQQDHIVASYEPVDETMPARVTVPDDNAAAIPPQPP